MLSLTHNRRLLASKLTHEPKLAKPLLIASLQTFRLSASLQQTGDPPFSNRDECDVWRAVLLSSCNRANESKELIGALKGDQNGPSQGHVEVRVDFTQARACIFKLTKHTSVDPFARTYISWGQELWRPCGTGPHCWPRGFWRGCQRVVHGVGIWGHDGRLSQWDNGVGCCPHGRGTGGTIEKVNTVIYFRAHARNVRWGNNWH